MLTYGFGKPEWNGAGGKILVCHSASDVGYDRSGGG